MVPAYRRTVSPDLVRQQKPPVVYTGRGLSHNGCRTIILECAGTQCLMDYTTTFSTDLMHLEARFWPPHSSHSSINQNVSPCCWSGARWRRRGETAMLGGAWIGPASVQGQPWIGDLLQRPAERQERQAENASVDIWSRHACGGASTWPTLAGGGRNLLEVATSRDSWCKQASHTGTAWLTGFKGGHDLHLWRCCAHLHQQGVIIWFDSAAWPSFCSPWIDADLALARHHGNGFGSMLCSCVSSVGRG